MVHIICSGDTHSLKGRNCLLYQQKRKKHNAGSKWYETNRPKRRRVSVLRLSGETEREGPSSPSQMSYLEEDAQGRRVGRSASTRGCLGENFEECPDLRSIFLDGGEDEREEQPTSLHESTEDVHLHNLDHSIVQFTVGANEPTEPLLPIIGSSLGPVDFLDSLAKTNLSEPSECTLPPPFASEIFADYSFYVGFCFLLLRITGWSNNKCGAFVLVILSSDDEREKSCDVPQCCNQGLHTLVSLEDTVIEGKFSQEEKQQEEVSDSEDTEVGMCFFSR